MLLSFHNVRNGKAPPATTTAAKHRNHSRTDTITHQKSALEVCEIWSRDVKGNPNDVAPPRRMVEGWLGTGLVVITSGYTVPGIRTLQRTLEQTVCVDVF